MRRRSKQTSTDGLRKWIIENFAAFRAAARSSLEHLFQNRRAIDIGQDRGALDGVVVLIKGKGTGDALDGAILDAIDHSLLVLIGACFQTSVLRSLNAVAQGNGRIVAQRREAVGVVLAVLLLVRVLKVGVGALCVCLLYTSDAADE